MKYFSGSSLFRVEIGLRRDVQVGGGEVKHGLQIGEGAVAVAAGFAFCRGEDTSSDESSGEVIAVQVSGDSIKMLEDCLPDALHV